MTFVFVQILIIDPATLLTIHPQFTRQVEKAKLKDVNMCKASFDTAILNEQHQREKDAKAKVRAQPAENAKFDMANALFSGVKDHDNDE
jgi:hypothetical protein